MKIVSAIGHEFPKSVLLGENTPGVIRSAIPADALRLAEIERSVWSDEHAAPLATIRRRIKLNPAGTLVLCSNDQLRYWGFYSLVPVEEPDSTNLNNWDYYANLAVSEEHFRRSRRFTHMHSVSLTVADEAPRRAATMLVRVAAERSWGAGLQGATIVTRAPHYHLYSNKMEFSDYHTALANGSLQEPSFKLCINAGGVPDGFMASYFEDPESCDYGLVFRFPSPLALQQVNPLKVIATVRT